MIKKYLVIFCCVVLSISSSFARNDMTIGFGPSFFENDDLGSSSGLSLLMNIRASLPETFLDLEFRFQGVNHNLDDVAIYNSYYSYPVYLHDGDLTMGDIRGQVIINLLPDFAINPYLAVGCVFRSIAVEYDVSYRRSYFGYPYSAYSYVDEDENDATYSLAAGLDIDLPTIYLRGEVAYIGETFTDYGGEDDIVVYADVGLKLVEGFRIGVAGSYYVNTEIGLGTINCGFEF